MNENERNEVLKKEIDKITEGSSATSKTFSSMEKLTLLFDFTHTREMELFYSNKERTKEEIKLWKQYKTGLKHILSEDKDFKKRIINSYNLDIEENVIPPIIINPGISKEVVFELFSKIFSNTEKEKKRIENETSLTQKQKDKIDEDIERYL